MREFCFLFRYFSNIVQQTHIPNLAFISCGALAPNPSELLGSLFMKRFLDEAMRKFAARGASGKSGTKKVRDTEVF